jgi:L,D-peptidoglycan transpeptidase YkuD (ErfK/YbiS/YcfS/YnhG family)
MYLQAFRRTLLLATLIAGFTATPSAAQEPAQETAPCAKLTTREVRFTAGEASRVVFVTATETKQNAVLITGCVRTTDGYAQEWQSNGFIGENGFAPEGMLREGELQSPTGSFSATEALGLADPGTKLTYHLVNRRSRWGGPGSSSYNNYLEGGSAADENLWYWANQGTYAQATVINYNRLPDSSPVPGADYAIFFGAGNRVSAGCVSTTLEASTRVVKTLVPGDRFIMGVVRDVFGPAPQSVGPAPAASATPDVTSASAAATPSPSASTTGEQSAPAPETNGSDFLPLGILLVAGGGTAMAVYFVLRKQGSGTRL